MPEIPQTPRVIAARIWTLCNVLRGDGISYNQYISELTYLLFLKIAQENGSEVTLPQGYRWADLVSYNGSNLLGHYQEMLTHLGTSAADERVRDIYAFPTTVFSHSENLRVIIDGLDTINWHQLSQDGLGQIYEALLAKNSEDARSGAGQYFTPRALVDTIVTVTRPQAGELIQDPATGTGGLARMFVAETQRLAMSMCLSSIVLTPQTTATGAGMAGGRQERTDDPAGRGGLHPKGRNEEEELAQPACGTPRRDHRVATPTRQNECRRPTPRRVAARPQPISAKRDRLQRSPQKQHSRVQPAVAAACARARAPAAAAPPGRIECATRKTKGAADPGGFAEARQRTLISHCVPLPGDARRIGPPGLIPRPRSSPGWAEAHRDSAARKRVERSHAARETPWADSLKHRPLGNARVPADWRPKGGAFMFATRALGHGYPAGFQTMPGNHESWLAALAFCDEHGEDGPDILAGNIEASWRSHNAAAAMHWTDIGQRLIHMHLAGARAWH